VRVSAVVPTRAAAKIDGKRTAARVLRPTRLERRSTSGWVAAARASTTRAGRVAYSITTPQASTAYRIVAPAKRVLVNRKVGGRTVSKRVTLRAWTGPVRMVSVTAPPTQQPTQQPTAVTELLRVRSDGTGGVGAGTGELSADGRWVAFEAYDGILPGDSNGVWDVFLHDRVTGTTVLVSHDVVDGPGNGASYNARISADGRFVVFQSDAGDLTQDDENEALDVFVFDRWSGSVDLVSRTEIAVGNGHSVDPDISADGRYVVFATFADNLRPDTPHGDTQVVLVDRQTGLLHPVSRPSLEAANGSSGQPSISDDGRRIVFSSMASDLVSRDGNGTADVFVWDNEAFSLRAVSRTPSRTTATGASTAARISGDGSTIVYASEADDLVADDDNEASDVFRYDVTTRRTSMVSRTPLGRPGNGASDEADVNGDGSRVVFISRSTDLDPSSRRNQVFLAEGGQPIKLVSMSRANPRPGNGQTRRPSISADGSVVAFYSDSSDLVEGTTTQEGRLYVRLRP
jgi:Tol biopolymer transport system component